ncbi:MAG: hypothetical protein ACOX1J_02940 [Dethiobacteria bacterium]
MSGTVIFAVGSRFLKSGLCLLLAQAIAIDEGREEAHEGKLKAYDTVHEMWAEIEAEE